jgi:hypothetical protein
MFTLNCDRAYLFAYPERELTAEGQTRYDVALAEPPVACQRNTSPDIRNSGAWTIVTPAVLIPRPETEHAI